MVDVTRRSGLETLVATTATADPASAAVVARLDAGAGFINLRGDAGDAGFGPAVEDALALALPVEANTLSSGDRRIYWLGPDEWLVRTRIDETRALCSALRAATSELHSAVNEQSGGLVSLLLTGEAVEDMLARGTTLDVHSSRFTRGSCAQTGLAKASVLMARLDEQTAFEIVVRRSFSDYLLRWIAHTVPPGRLALLHD